MPRSPYPFPVTFFTVLPKSTLIRDMLAASGKVLVMTEPGKSVEIAIASDIAPPELKTLTIDELAALARQENEQTAAHLLGAFGHAIRLGEVLIEARQRVETRGWKSFLEGADVHYNTAERVMRLAFYKDKLPPEALAAWRRSHDGGLQNPTWNRALEYIKYLPPLTWGQRGHRTSHIEQIAVEARRLRSEGLEYREIAGLLGSNITTVYNACTPEKDAERRSKARLYQRQQRDARNALKRQKQEDERRRLAKTTGGELEEAWSLIRRALIHLDRVIDNQHVSVAIRYLHKAEDEAAAAMRLARQDQP